MFDRFTDWAKKVMGLSRQEALELDHYHIGSQHLLLALTHESMRACAAAGILTSLGIDLEKVRVEVVRRLERGSSKVAAGQLPFTRLAIEVLELSTGEALGLGSREFGTQHLLLGILKSADGVPALVLAELGVEYDAVHAKARAWGPELPT